MYINTKILRQHNLNLQQVSLLQILHQNKTEDMSELLESYNGDLDVLNEKGLLSEIKAKSKQESVYKRLRLSKKGSELLEDLCIPEVTEGDLKMRDYLIEMYLNHEDTERTVGNKKKIAMYISIMRNRLNLTLHEFFYLCEYFLAEYPYTKVLEYIFFNSNKNRYGKFENHLEDSPLYQFFDEKKKEVEYYWGKRIK